MPKILDLKGQKFNRLTVIDFAFLKKNRSFFTCQCDCGNLTTVASNHLKYNGVKSCGCLNLELVSQRLKTHGRSGTRSYIIWVNMRIRCSDQKSKYYFKYGGNGIRVCKRWINSFKNFIKDMGEPPTDKHTLDRIKNEKGYFKSNCRWATRKEQADNRSNVIHEILDGIKMNSKQLKTYLGISYPTLNKYRSLGYDAEGIRKLLFCRTATSIGVGIIENNTNKSRVEEIDGIKMNRRQICNYLKIPQTTMYRYYSKGFTTHQIRVIFDAKKKRIFGR